MEGKINTRTTKKVEVGEKRNSEGFPNSNKKKKVSKFGLKNRKIRDNGEARRCKMCKVKHDGQYIEVMTCYRCDEIGHYDNRCTADHKLCFKCGEVKDFKDNCLKKKGAAKPIVLKAWSIQMILDAVRNEASVI